MKEFTGTDDENGWRIPQEGTEEDVDFDASDEASKVDTVRRDATLVDARKSAGPERRSTPQTSDVMFFPQNVDPDVQRPSLGPVLLS